MVQMRPPKERFFVVLNLDEIRGRAPTVFHLTQESAEKEAHRLAVEHAGTEFYVAAVYCHYVIAPPPPPPVRYVEHLAPVPTSQGLVIEAEERKL